MHLTSPDLSAPVSSLWNFYLRIKEILVYVLCLYRRFLKDISDSRKVTENSSSWLRMCEGEAGHIVARTKQFEEEEAKVTTKIVISEARMVKVQTTIGSSEFPGS